MMEVDEEDSFYRVDILYGPSEVYGIVEHRPERVLHVKDRLEKLGFTVKLRRISDYEMVGFAFEGHVVFSCNAKNLSYMGCSSNDPVADLAVRKLMEVRDSVTKRDETVSKPDSSRPPSEQLSEEMSLYLIRYFTVRKSR